MSTHSHLVDDYSASPTPATLVAVRAEIRAAANFDANLVPLEVIGPLVATGQYAQLVTALSALMPGALLSPSVHAALADALARTGQTEAAKREGSLARLGIQSILSTGDGSRARPYSVLRISDEYDTVLGLGRRTRSQALMPDQDRTLDVHTCDDGSLVYFDVDLLPDHS